MIKKQKKMYPIPEAIDGERWSVNESKSAMTDTKERTMYVPATDSEQGRYLRAHETAHARITPKVHANAASRKHGISVEAMQACEDLRVNEFLNSRHIDREGGIGSQDMCDALVKMCADDPRKLGQLLVSTMTTDDHDRLLESIERVIGDYAFRESIIDCTEAVRKTFTEALCEGGGSRLLSLPRGFVAATVPAARMFDRLFPVDAEFNAGESGMLGTYIASYGGRLGAKWGKISRVIRSRMSRRRKPRGNGGKSWRDEGATPTAPYRLILDGRIFCRRQRVKGGTVLIDNSGSMSFSSDDLERIVTTAPGAVVAAYSGYRSSGELAIVAERGRMASKHDLDAVERHGGNVIDGPALRWLASMPGPRVWVSDGFVTGCDDCAGTNLLEESMAICKQASISRVDRAAAVAEALK